MHDLISVIVPVYNIASYLSRCINSILCQTYAEIEIIAVDDGSKDNSLQILQKFMTVDKRLRVIHQENSGVTKARITGIKAAKGEWIGFVDGDDFIEPDMYEHLLSNAHKYHADISHCGYQLSFFDQEKYYYNTGCLKQQNNQRGLIDLIEGSFIGPGLWNKLYHKNLFQHLLDTEVLDLSICNYEDLLMNYYLFQAANNSVYEDFCPYHYILRNNSATTSKTNEHKLLDPLIVLKKIKAETTKNQELQNLINARIAMQLINISTESSSNQLSLIKHYQSQARRELHVILPDILHGTYSKKLKIIVAVAAIFPGMYKLIHQVYSVLRYKKTNNYTLWN